MNDQELDSHIDLVATQQGLTIAPEWRASVVSFYKLSMHMAHVLEEQPLEPLDEPAPVFTP